MITYEGSEEPVICPYCKSDDECKHLFAFYDLTYNTIDGGYIFEREEYHTILLDFFYKYIKKHGFTKKLINGTNKELQDIWREILYNKKNYSFNEETGNWNIDLPSNVNRYVFELLDDIIAPDYCESEDGPGGSSLYKIYYSKDVVSDYNNLIELVRKESLLILN